MIRELTSMEKTVVSLITSYEKGIDAKHNSFQVTISDRGYPQIKRGQDMGLYKFFSVKEEKPKSTSDEVVYKLRFRTHEFESCLHYLLSQSNMAYMDYTLVLQDGLKVLIE